MFWLLVCPGISPGTKVGLNLKRPMYLGGVDPEVKVAPGVGVDNGFHGCIGEVSGQMVIDDAAHGVWSESK